MLKDLLAKLRQPVWLFYVCAFVALAVVQLRFSHDVGVSHTLLQAVEVLLAEGVMALAVYWIWPRHMRGLVTIWMWVLSLFLGANAIYFRKFGDLMPLSSVFSAESYNSFVWDSGIALMQLGDLVYLLMPLALTATWALLRHSPTERWTWRRSAVCVLGSCAVYLLCHAVLLWHGARYYRSTGYEKWTYIDTYRWIYENPGIQDGIVAYQCKGLNHYLWSIVRIFATNNHIELSPVESAEIEKYAAHRAA
jgi:hypothetical protein